MLSLDHRAVKVKDDFNAEAPPQGYTQAMLAYRKFLSGEELSREERIAFGIRESKRQSEILEALLLSGCPSEEIEEAFRAI